MERETDETILKVLLTLPKHHPLRLQAMAVMADSQASIKKPDSVLHVLLSTTLLWKKERRIAGWLVEHANWSEAQRLTIQQTLSRTVGRATSAKGPGRKIARWFCRGMLVSMLVLALSPDIFMDPWLTGINFLLDAVALTIFSSLLSVPLSFLFDDRALRRLIPAIDILGRFGRPADIAVLVDASLHKHLQGASESALSNIVARLRPEDYGTLPMQAIPSICQVLKTTSPQVAFLVLEAFFTIGDGRAIPAVDYLLHNAIQPEMREMCKTLLPILLERARDSQNAALLLRPSTTPVDSRQTLLRAAHDQSTTDSSQLLRMAATTGSDEGTAG